MMQEFSIDQLKALSGLPGPRGNLELLSAFIHQGSDTLVESCLAVIADDTTNSPEEFLGMCGVAGFALRHTDDQELVIGHLRQYAVHSSWRIREAVAIALQEMPFPDLAARVAFTDALELDHPLVHRAIIAGLCEPKNLKKQNCGQVRLFDQLERSTGLLNEGRKLSEGEESLRKALGYCWSVAIVAFPETGKGKFEALAQCPAKHIRWVVNENLKKNRLERLDPDWVAGLKGRISPSSLG